MASSTGSLVVELLQERQSRTLATWIHGAIRTTDGATNRIAVEVHGQELRCFVNGQFVGRVTSPQVVQGDYGFIVGGTGGSAVFSNLKVVDFN